MRLLAFVGFLCSVGALPAKTLSAVCPAINFDQRLDVMNGGAMFTFVPQGTHHFDFVNVIISLESLDGIVLKEKSYPMVLGQNGVFQKQVLEDTSISEVLQRKRPNIVMKYSFTYCVMLANGGNADCNTEHFLFEQADWRAGDFPPCPTTCGLPASIVTREVICGVVGSGQATNLAKCTSPAPDHAKQCPATAACVSFHYREAMTACSDECGLQAYAIETVNGCIGSDGKPASIEACRDQPKPEPVFCPATPPCVSWKWSVKSTQCPSTCGYPGGIVMPEAVCTGSNSKIDNSQCSNLPRPPALNCPATAPCLSFSWRAEHVECPQECGFEGKMVKPKIACIGTDGRQAHNDACANMPLPPEVLCPATDLCVQVFWKALEVRCPEQCGYPGGLVTPQAICMGTDGEEHQHQCKDLARPEPVVCPATGPCVQFHWVAQQIICPTECGFAGGSLTPEADCVGTNGRTVDDFKCSEPKPGAVVCPATFPCASFYWKATELNCPSACGQSAKMVKPEAVCMDNHGKIQRDEACASLRSLASVLCPATATCVDFHWVQASVVECSKACGQPAVTYEPGQLGFEIKCVGTTGDVYPATKCANAPRLPSVHCLATAPCEHAFWKSGRVECPTECGLPASVILPEISCVSTISGVSRPTDGSKCNEHDKPIPVNCPATTPCLLPKYCPAIDYVEEIKKTDSTFHVTFKPLIQHVEKYYFEFIDLHIILENVGGPIMPAQNYRMTQTDFTWHFTLPTDVASKLMSIQHNGRMVYWFTYCIGSFPNNIDCDTERKFFYL